MVMPKLIPYFLLMLLLSPKIAFAEVKVEISNNTGGSNNNVRVNSSNNVQSQTNIKINNNGEVKEYHGSDEKVEMKTSDGKSSVTVNTTGASNNSTNSSTSVNSKTNITVNSKTDDSSVSASSSPEATVAGVVKESKEIKEESNFWNYLRKELESLFKLFH